MAVNSINVPMHLTLSVRALLSLLSHIYEHSVVSFITIYLDFLGKMNEHNEILWMKYPKDDLSEGVTQTQQEIISCWASGRIFLSKSTTEVRRRFTHENRCRLTDQHSPS